MPTEPISDAPYPQPIVEAAALLTHALNSQSQPHAVFEAFDTVCINLFGRHLLTAFAWTQGSAEVERLYTSHPEHYPKGARKLMGPTPWGALVLEKGRPWLGCNADDIRWAFPDYELILSLGCLSCMNVPIRWKGETLGAVSVLDAEDSYSKDTLLVLNAFSGFLVAPLLAHHQSAL
ncbi:GAF domain-containing protein [Pseudochrobactrum sp. sp1633]|uniref:GAF domain-containing protein n=1 Tax=Pseudochrobactrum sp. sp1633 TaxID=3036706 RepID=UPI0025A5D756|nr:GAF domain-containing protein [Pseudochrobactrum sp. sp1633]MDM8347182.1 GAF domain-containing protein [Pseudochrobactrum sp. sp1633]